MGIRETHAGWGFPDWLRRKHRRGCAYRYVMRVSNTRAPLSSVARRPSRVLVLGSARLLGPRCLGVSLSLLLPPPYLPSASLGLALRSSSLISLCGVTSLVYCLRGTPRSLPSGRLPELWSPTGICLSCVPAVGLTTFPLMSPLSRGDWCHSSPGPRAGGGTCVCFPPAPTWSQSPTSLCRSCPDTVLLLSLAWGSATLQSSLW